MSQAARDSGADYIALAGYMRILGPEIVAEWAGRMLNIHPSLLPKYKGLDTHARALAAGDSMRDAASTWCPTNWTAGRCLAKCRSRFYPPIRPQAWRRACWWRNTNSILACWRSMFRAAVTPTHLLDRVRALALALPHTHERDSHGAPGWRVGSEKSGKYFAYFNDRHHGTDHVALLVKTGGMDELLDLVEAQPERYFKPAYYGASGWIGVILDRPGLDWNDVAEWLERSWRAVAPPSLTRLQAAIDAF
jgi:phosphoribosylglycinamide formyltransferase-1